MEIKIDPKAIQNLIDFGIDFLMILARFGGPSCGHVGNIFGKKAWRLWDALAIVVELLLSFEFWCVWAEFGPYWAPFWFHLGLILAPFGHHFGSFWDPFWFHLGSAVVVAVGVGCVAAVVAAAAVVVVAVVVAVGVVVVCGVVVFVGVVGCCCCW